MASSSSLLSEDQFQCYICLDVFTDPVSTPCGHNYCKACITQYWDNSDLCQCPMCQRNFPRKPDIFVNTMLRDVVENYKKNANVKKESQAKPEDVSCYYCTGTKLIVLMSCLVCLAFYCETQYTAHRMCQKHDTPLELFCRTDQTCVCLFCTEIRVHSSSVGAVRRAVSQLEETLKKEMDKMSDPELKWIQQYTVDVTLDPDTAHPKLILSEDGKQVRHGDIRQDLPDNPERFDTCVIVLGKQGFSSGRFYWEVQVEGKTGWDLGVARESINRKEQITGSPENGYWLIWLRKDSEYMALADPPVLLSLRQKPQKVGVFLDYEEGLVSFYDVEARSHIYSFIGCIFTEKLYPYFSPCLNDEGENSAPLIISPVTQ